MNKAKQHRDKERQLTTSIVSEQGKSSPNPQTLAQLRLELRGLHEDLIEGVKVRKREEYIVKDKKVTPYFFKCLRERRRSQHIKEVITDPPNKRILVFLN